MRYGCGGRNNYTKLKQLLTESKLPKRCGMGAVHGAMRMQFPIEMPEQLQDEYSSLGVSSS